MSADLHKSHVIDGYLTINYCNDDKPGHAHFLTHIETEISTEDLDQVICMTAPTIYTSAVNAHILKNYFKCDRHITALEYGKTYQIYTALNTVFIFTCIRSYYNCGSMVLIARGNFGTVIYTGFSPRNLESLMSVNIIKGIIQQKALTRLYLDCTYYKISRRFFSVQEFINLVLQFFQSRKNQFYVHVPIFGLEDILARVASGLKEKMVVDEKRMDLIQFLGLEDNFTLNKAEGRLHIISQGIMKRKNDGFSSQLVFIKVVNDYSETSNSYVCDSKIHFFTLFPHATDQDCAEIINTMKPKEVIPIHCRFNLNEDRAFSGSIGSNLMNEEPNAIKPSGRSAVRRKTVNERYRSSDSVMTDGRVKLKKRKQSEVNENENLSDVTVRNQPSLYLSNDIDEANDEDYAPVVKVRRRKFSRRKTRKTNHRIEKTSTGFSKVQTICSQEPVMTMKKGFARKSLRNTSIDPQKIGEIITKNNEALVSSLVLECDKQTDSFPLSLIEKDQELLSADLNINDGEALNGRDYTTVETTGYNPSHNLGNAVYENVSNDVMKNSVMGAKLVDYFVSDEHTYARPVGSKVGSDNVEEWAAQVQDDEEPKSDYDNGRQLNASKSPVRQMELHSKNGVSEVMNQNCGKEHALGEVGTDFLSDKSLNENNSDGSLASCNIPLESVKSVAIDEECNATTGHSTELVQNEVEDDSDDCIIQENSCPDIIELSDSSNDGLEFQSKEGTNGNCNSNHFSEPDTENPPTCAVKVDKLTLPHVFHNTVCKDSGREEYPSGNTKKYVYLAKSLTRVPISLSSSPVIKRVFRDALVKSRPSLILQKCPNSAVNPGSLRNINNFSTNPRIVLLKPSQNAKGFLLQKVAKTFTPGSQSQKVIDPSINEVEQCQTSKRCIPILSKPSVPSGDETLPTSIIVEKTMPKQLEINIKTNQVKTAEDNCSFSSSLSDKGINEININEPSKFDQQSDNYSQVGKSSDRVGPGCSAQSMVSDSQSTKDCTSNKPYCSQNLEDRNKISPSTENYDKGLSAKLKIKNLADLVTNPSYLKAVEPRARVNSPIAAVPLTKRTLCCNENIEDVNNSDFCPPDYNAMLRREVVDNSGTCDTNKMSWIKSSRCSNSPPTLTAYDNISPENGCPEMLELSPPTLIAEVEKPDPLSQPMIGDSENRNLNNSFKASKKKRKRKKSVWMKITTKKKMCKWKDWKSNSSTLLREMNDSRDENSDNVKSLGKPSWSISENTPLNSPIVYKNMEEFLGNQCRSHEDSLLLTKFNIDEAYVAMVPGFKDTPYKYKPNKQCYVQHKDREEDVYMDGMLIGKFINYKVRNKNKTNIKGSNTKSVGLPNLKPFYENISGILPEKLSTTVEVESCDNPLPVESNQSSPSSPVCRDRGELSATQETNNSTIVTTQSSTQRLNPNSAYQQLLDKQNLSAYVSKNVAQNIFTILANVVHNEKNTDKPIDIPQTQHSGDLNKDSVLTPLETSVSVKESAINCPSDRIVSSEPTENLKGDLAEVDASSSNMAGQALQISKGRPKRNSNQSLLYSSLEQLKRNKRVKKVLNKTELSGNCHSSTDTTAKKKEEKCPPMSREVTNLRNFLSGKSEIMNTLTSQNAPDSIESSTNQLDRDLSFLAKELFDGHASNNANKLLTPNK